MEIHVNVIPKSSQKKIIKINELEYKIYIHEAPDKGKANESVINVLSEYFSIKKSQIKIISGLKSRKKILSLKINK